MNKFWAANGVQPWRSSLPLPTTCIAPDCSPRDLCLAVDANNPICCTNDRQHDAIRYERAQAAAGCKPAHLPDERATARCKPSLCCTNERQHDANHHSCPARTSAQQWARLVVRCLSMYLIPRDRTPVRQFRLLPCLCLHSLQTFFGCRCFLFLFVFVFVGDSGFP
jgi:hypothetical protein